MAAINKRTIVLLVVAVAIWVVAIFVLVMSNKPKTSTPSPSTQSATAQTPVQPGQSVQQPPTDTATQTTNPATQTVNVENLSLVEIENLIPESTFSDFLTPYILDLKVNVQSSLFQGAILQEETPEEATQEQVVSSKSSNQSVSSKPQTSQQPTQRTTSRKTSTAETVNLSTAEINDIDGIYYVGYMSIHDGNREIKKVYVQIGEETKSFPENELINGIYKILQVSPTFIIVLDTTDGRVKRIRQVE